MNEFTKLLQDFLTSKASLVDCAEWLAGVYWDDPEMTEDEQEAFGLFELLITEVAEGMRPEAELRAEATRLEAKLRAETPSLALR